MPPERFEQSVTFLYAEDPAACRRFYADVLGLALVLDQGPCAIFAVAGGRGFLGICQARSPRAALPARETDEARREGGVVFTLVTQDVDGWHERLREAGASGLTAPAYSATYDVFGFFFRDPAGYLFEIQRFGSAAWPLP